AGRIPVQPVYELEKLRLRAGGTQLFDQTVGDAAAAVDGQTRRLVDSDQCVVLVQDRRIDRARQRPAANSIRRGGSYRRNAELVASCEPRVGLHPLAVDPNLAA